jgi:hypothetical protein
MARRKRSVETERLQLRGGVLGLEVRSNAPGGELMHLKGYCVDHRLLRTGSANFSRSVETRRDNGRFARRIRLRRVWRQVRPSVGKELNKRQFARRLQLTANQWRLVPLKTKLTAPNLEWVSAPPLTVRLTFLRMSLLLILCS